MEELLGLIGRGKKLLLVGVGNVLKRDDGVGVHIVQHIRESKFIKTLVVEQSIEKYIGQINKTECDIIILVDACDLGKDPGSVSFLPVDKLHDQTTHTHNISLTRVSEFFTKPVMVLAIQPADISFGEEITKKLIDAADLIIKELNFRFRALVKSWI